MIGVVVGKKYLRLPFNQVLCVSKNIVHPLFIHIKTVRLDRGEDKFHFNNTNCILLGRQLFQENGPVLTLSPGPLATTNVSSHQYVNLFSINHNLQHISQLPIKPPRTFLNVVIRECTSIFQLLSCEDQSLLIWRDALFILNFGLHIFNCV